LKTTTIHEENDLNKSSPEVQTVAPVNQQKQVNKNFIAGKVQAIQNACVKTFGEYKVQVIKLLIHSLIIIIINYYI